MVNLRHVTRMAVLAGVLAAVLARGAMAAYDVVYEGPKTWLPGYTGSGSYDVADNRWYTNCFENKSADSWSRITFIDSAGNWVGNSNYEVFSYGFCFTYGSGGEAYQKKPFCKNTDSITYTGQCRATRNRY